MKTIKSVLALLLLGFLISCGTNDDEVANMSPMPITIGNLTLTTPVDQDELVPIVPTLTWEAFESEENVTYTVFLGTSATQLNPIAENLNTLELLFDLDNDLILETGTTYHWKVEANIQGELVAESDIQGFETEFIAPRVLQENAAFSKRSRSAVASFNNRLWLIGGKNEADEPLGDIWSSTDGTNWVLESDTPSFGAIHSHNLIEFDGRLWIYGGIMGGFTSRSILSSEDGINWITHSEETPFIHYRYGVMHVFDNKLWRFAGYNGSLEVLSDERYVYSSTNGIDWVLETENHGLPEKYTFGIEVYNDQLYAASNENIIFKSGDGILWNSVSEESPDFIIGSYPIITAVADRLVVMTTSRSSINGVFQSEDGMNWSQATTKSYQTGILRNAYAALNGKHYLVAGGFGTGEENNSIWILN